MNNTRKRSFTALLFVLASLFVLVLSLGIFCACDGGESANVESANGSWYYGDEVPSAELGKMGDHYLNTQTLTAYAKAADGTWQSTTLYSGAEAPDNANGQPGDLYLATKDGVLYQKGDSLWSIVLTLQGKPGRDGVVWFSGDKNPETGDSALTDAQKGDFYLNTEDFTVWQLIEKDGKLTWTSLGGLTGAQGAIGPAGAQGPAGPTGAQGPTGPQGPAGQDGEDGTNGQDGKSAYELYVKQYVEDNGSEDGMLTEKQWLESLKGEQGEQGKQGETGKTGDQGPTGPDGKSAYELYVEQYKTEHPGEESGWMSEKEWLDSLKGDKGDAGKDSVHFFYGDGKPGAEITEQAVEGDLYVGRFSGTDGTSKGSGSILYVFHNGDWEVLMENITPATISIFSLEKLIEFSNLVAEGKIADGAEVHLKADINFGGTEGMSLYSVLAASAVDWTPIGTTAHPFNGTFDGEGHTITGLTVSGTSAGLFAVTEDASIKNLTIVDATVEAATNGKAGILVAEAKGTLEVKNVNIENGTVKAAEKATDTTLGALVGSAAEAGNVTVGDVTVELTEDSAPTQEDKPFVGSGEVTYDKASGSASLKEEVSEGFAEMTDFANEGKKSYEISSIEGFKTFCDNVNGGETYAEMTITLATEIDLTAVSEGDWTPIGQDGHFFAGTFDGQNNIISNLTITTETEGAGLFSKLADGAEIKNLTLDTVNITGTTKIGGFAGSNEGACTFTNCTVKNANLTGQNEIGAFIGSCVNGTVNTSSLEKVHITVDWEKESHGDTVDVGAYIGKDTNPTVDAASKASESEVTFEYKGIMAKVGSKVYANVQDAFYAVYDMGPDADEQGDIVIELLQDVTVNTADAKGFTLNGYHMDAWIDAFGVDIPTSKTGHVGSNETKIDRSWPSYTFDGNGHTITNNLSGGSYNLFYMGRNTDWTITIKNLNVKGGKCYDFYCESEPIGAKEITFENVTSTSDSKASRGSLGVGPNCTVILKGCTFTTEASNVTPISSQSYGGKPSKVYLLNGTKVTAWITNTDTSTAGNILYIDRTSGFVGEDGQVDTTCSGLKTLYASKPGFLSGVFIFEDETIPEALGMTSSVTITYEQAQKHPDYVASLKPLQEGETETQWFFDSSTATKLENTLNA